MFKKMTVINTVINGKRFGVGLAFDTEDMLFGVRVSTNLPGTEIPTRMLGTLIQVGIGPFNLYIGLY